MAVVPKNVYNIICVWKCKGDTEKPKHYPMPYGSKSKYVYVAYIVQLETQRRFHQGVVTFGRGFKESAVVSLTVSRS